MDNLELVLSAYIQVSLHNRQGTVIRQISVFDSYVTLVTHFLNQLSSLH
ncbi:hypothetical protein [Oenococcus sicerae]